MGKDGAPADPGFAVVSEDAEAVPLRPAGLDDDIGYRLRLAQILSFRAFEEVVEGYGAAPRYLGLMAIIEGNPDMPQGRLAQAIGLKRSSLVSILDRLEAEGLLERRASADDRRSKVVSLTDRGRTVTDELRGIANRLEDRALQGLDADARRGLRDGLDRIIANLRD